MNAAVQPAAHPSTPRGVQARPSLYTAGCVVMDMVLLLLGLALAIGLREAFSAWFHPLKPLAVVHWPEPSMFYLLGLLISWMSLVYEGVYSTGLSRLDRTEGIVKSLSWSFFLLILVTFTVQQSAAVSRLLLFLWYVICIFVLVLLRPLGERSLVRASRFRVNLDLLGEIDICEDTREALESMGFRALGAAQQLSAPPPATAILSAESEAARRHLVELEVRYHEIGIIPPRISVSALGSEPVNVRGAQIFVISHPLRRWTNRAIKRGIDVAGALALLAASLPFGLVIAALIRWSDGGPILFSQPRCGRSGRPYRIWKFRTMVPDAEARLQHLLRDDAAARAEFLATGKLKRDPRVTGPGRWLRRWSLDELPQFCNVLKGDMSLVGPRPIANGHEQELFGPAYAIVTSVRPGLTGIWQTSGRSDTSYYSRRDFDLYYVRRWSLWLDLAILAKTLQAVILPGAY